MVTGLAPLIQIDSLSRDGEHLELVFLVSNRNDQSLHLTGARLRAKLDQAELFAGEWPLDVDITARGRERVRLEVIAGHAGLDRLDELATGDRRSIPYQLEGVLNYDRRRSARIDQQGFLHPVPGRPGHFR